MSENSARKPGRPPKPNKMVYYGPKNRVGRPSEEGSFRAQRVAKRLEKIKAKELKRLDEVIKTISIPFLLPL